MSNYICNKAGSQTFCNACHHSTPHEKVEKQLYFLAHGSAIESCTTWGECRDGDGNVACKVRCVKEK